MTGFFTFPHKAQHRNERGAAILMVLLIGVLLFVAGGALVLTTAMLASAHFDSTATKQAYYGAETGLQATLNTLRGNVEPDASLPADTLLSFRNAVSLSTSNKTSDKSTAARLSAWLPYSAEYTDRVPISANYAPFSGIAYSVEVMDPDNTVSTEEPARLIVRVTGYGPHNAIKRLEMMVKKPVFEFEAPAVLTMRGADSVDLMTFSIGNSASKEYSGEDWADEDSTLPTFAITSAADKAVALAAITKEETVNKPETGVLDSSTMPSFLKSANAARTFVTDLKSYAEPRGRYFKSLSGTAGTSSKPEFTFVDGDCDLDGGAGLLVVTGTLRMNGNPSFDGVILVLGGGTVERDGSGNGQIYGAMVVAKFGATGDFLAPSFTTNGDGTSVMQYDSVWVQRALGTVGLRVMGIREY